MNKRDTLIKSLQLQDYRIGCRVAFAFVGVLLLYTFAQELSTDHETDEITEYIAPAMLRIPAGTLLMGAETSSFDHEKAERLVTIPEFELSRNELTWAEWTLCEDDDGCTSLIRPEYLEAIDADERPDHPVTNVNINSVNEYLNWISHKSSRAYRLPHRVEWEYAARAGNTTTYSWGDAIGVNNANCNGCGSEWDNKTTAPVGSFNENSFGLNDMHGNAWEWVADFSHDNCQGISANGSVRDDDCLSYRSQVILGGSWNSSPEELRARGGYTVNSSIAYDIVSFRLAASLP